MNRAAQALADALAGNIRVWIAAEAYTSVHVRNELQKAGIPVKWESGAKVRVKSGRLTETPDKDRDLIEVLWEPMDWTPADRRKMAGLLRGA